MRTGHENFQFEIVEIAAEFFEISIEVLLVLDLFRFGFSLAQLDHDLEIIELFLRFDQRINPAAQAIGFLDDLLSLFAIIPKTVRRHQRVQLAEALLRARYVKETSADAPVSHPAFPTQT